MVVGVHVGLLAVPVLRHSQRPEQQPDVPLVPAMGLLYLLTTPCADPMTGKDGFQFHGVLSCDIAQTSGCAAWDRTKDRAIMSRLLYL